MNEIIKDISAIASAIVGLAIITVLVRQGSNTVGVIQASTSGFAQVLTAAMGGGVTQGAFY